VSQTDPTLEEATAYAKAWLKKNDMTRAFKKAFPKSKANGKTLNERASVLHKHHKIRTRIDQLEETAREVAEEDYGITIGSQLEVLNRAIKLAFIPKKILIDGIPLPYDEDDPECSQGDYANLGAVKSLVEEQNKMLGLRAPEKKIITFEDLSDDDLDRQLEQLQRD